MFPCHGSVITVNINQLFVDSYRLDIQEFPLFSINAAGATKSAGTAIESDYALDKSCTPRGSYWTGSHIT